MSPPHPTTPYEGREPSNADIVAILTAQNRVQEKQSARLEVIERALLGSIEPQRSGALSRLRDLEKKVGAASKLAWVALLAVAAGAGTWLVNKLTGGHG